MHRIQHTLLASAVLVAGVWAGTAWSAPPPAAKDAQAANRAEMRQQMFDQLDANRDGKVTRAEYQAWVDQRFAEFDPAGKGSVNAEDLMQSAQFRERMQDQAKRMIQRYNPSGSQFSKADFEAVHMQRFDRLSKGADSVSKAEFESAGMHRGDKRGHADGKRMGGKGKPMREGGAQRDDKSGGAAKN